MSRLRLGIIGCGDAGSAVALVARLNGRIALTACADADQPGADAFARRHRIPFATGDYRALLDRGDVDAVHIATPHHLHAEMIRASADAGKHLLIEKPITRTADEAVAAVDYLRGRDLRAAVNYQYRYDAGCYALAMAARSGDLGRLLYGRVNVPWHRDAAYMNENNWHGKIAAAGGGTLLTQGSHLLDVLLWAFDSPPAAATGLTARRVFECVEVEDLAMGAIELASGALIAITSAMIARPEQAVTAEIYGTEGTGFYTNRGLPHAAFRPRRIARHRPPVRAFHAMQASVEAFRRWVGGGPPHLVPAEAAVPVLAAVEAIYRAARTGARQAVHPS